MLLTLAGIVAVALLLSKLGVITMRDHSESGSPALSVTSPSTAVAEMPSIPTAPPLSSTTPNYPGFEILDTRTSWVTVSKGFTALEGLLWVPEVRLKVRRTAPSHGELAVKAVFIDEAGTVLDEYRDSEEFEPGYVKELILTAGRGYPFDHVFLPMIQDPTKRFRVDVFAAKNYFGDVWTKILGIYVDLPAEYAAMSGHRSDDTLTGKAIAPAPTAPTARIEVSPEVTQGPPQ